MNKTGFFPEIGKFFFGGTVKKQPLKSLKDPHIQSGSSLQSPLIEERLLAFDRYCQDNKLSSLDYLNESARAFLALTQSGSIICVGPQGSLKGRDVLYIGTSRKESLTNARFKHSSNLKSKVIIGKRLIFEHGPIEKSSPLIKIASSPIYLDSTTIFGSYN